jgi:hypothetical protein
MNIYIIYTHILNKLDVHVIEQDSDVSILLKYIFRNLLRLISRDNYKL